ncbi:UNVERIFIED_CONTAM: hypothetical protein NY100_05455 [Prevotella sp. 15_C9]
MNEENLGHYRTFPISRGKIFRVFNNPLNKEYACLSSCLGQTQVVAYEFIAYGFGL